MSKRLAVFVLSACLLTLFFSAPATARAPQTCDSHLHFNDFTHDSEGFESLIKAMDLAGVDKAIVFGMPILKMWSESDPVRPVYYMDSDSRAYYYSATDPLLVHELMRQPASVRERFFPMISGINPLDLNSAVQIERLIKAYPGFWKGLGEIMSRHDDLTGFTYGEPPRANHPALLEVYGLARKYGLPVLIHHNISNSTVTQPAKPVAPIYLAEMEEALKKFPEVVFIWAHAGISRRVNVQGLPEIVSGLLDRYSNLRFDISWVVYDDYIKKDLDRWVGVLERYPDRFMIGSDAIGHWGNYKITMDRYNELLARLTPSTRAKLAGGNALEIMYKSPGAR